MYLVVEIGPITATSWLYTLEFECPYKTDIFHKIPELFPVYGKLPYAWIYIHEARIKELTIDPISYRRRRLFGRIMEMMIQHWGEDKVNICPEARLQKSTYETDTRIVGVVPDGQDPLGGNVIPYQKWLRSKGKVFNGET